MTSKTKYFQAELRSVIFATPTEQALDRLADYWEEANVRWFGGEMKPVPIVAGLEKTKKTMGTAGYDLRAGRYQIEIRESLLDRLEEPGMCLETTDVLLHEMIHQYIAARYLPGRNRLDEPTHGPEFTSWCNRIGSALGLGEVVARKPRGRKVPLSRHWPHSVRADSDYALISPRRIHFNRYAGQRLPRHTVLVTRPSWFGNPFLVAELGRDEAIRLHREWLGGEGPNIIEVHGMFLFDRSRVLELLPHLAGHDLACGCHEELPCHGDTLLELANAAP